ncbi:MAG TPA: radical SAM family heme chaperone HemW [Caulobacteraceae bacterium]|nr:radical SAM family heme chaperone HemW [Caulobacteraceae bacterium]
MTPAPLGIYVHWPYCARICPYCDFNVVRDRGRVAEQRALRGAILADLTAHAALTGPRPLVSIFLGGGTPSLMDPAWAAEIIETARGLWAPTSDLEVTLEANPTDAETARFAAFAEAGVNRLSLGVQSLDEAELEFLGRNHDAASARHAARRALAAFPRVSLDLIYALPRQGVAAWTDRLRAAIDLGAEHISPYQLTIEAGTAFDRSVRRGTLIAPGPDLAADLYETTQGVLEAAGFEAYEVSNHARGETARSRHNLIYWRGHDYVGVGPGAHGRLTLAAGRFATEAPREIAGYVAAAGEAGTRLERLSAPDIATERLLMGLRTVEGVALDELAALAIPPERLSRLGDLVSVQGSRLRVTRRGRPVLDRIVAQLAGNA